MPAARQAASTAARSSRQPASVSALTSVLRRYAKAARTVAAMAGQSPASSAHSGLRVNATSMESTFGTGTNTLRETACRPVVTSASAHSALGAP